MAAHFEKPGLIDRLFSGGFSLLLRIGIGFSHNYLLEVRGRKSGRIFRVPVDLLELNGRRYLVAPRGNTQWARNAMAAGSVTLSKRSRRQSFRVTAVAAAAKPEILKAYLDSFKTTVARFFPVAPGSDAAAFAPYSERYPVFELTAQ